MLLLVFLRLSLTDVEKMSVCCDKNMAFNLGDDSRSVIMPHEWTDVFLLDRPWLSWKGSRRGNESPPPLPVCPDDIKKINSLMDAVIRSVVIFCGRVGGLLNCPGGGCRVVKCRCDGKGDTG